MSGLQPHASPRVRWAWARTALAAVGAALSLGCAAVEHGLAASDYAGQALSTRSPRGAARLRDEARFDKSIAAYLTEHGKPDFLYIVDRQKLYLFWVESDRATKFDRVLMEASQAQELGRIPGSLMKWLPQQAQQNLHAKRQREQRHAQTRAKRSRAEQARSAPRQTAPGALAPGGAYLNAFEPEELVQRMREPLTAADPGVAGWRRARLRGGGVMWSAEAGRTRYEVSSRRIAFTTPISSSGGHLPGSARLAIQRLNNAIFAARAERVSQLAIELAERAAADRSGRTQFQKRVAGRTLRIGRLTGQGVFSYSIHP